MKDFGQQNKLKKLLTREATCDILSELPLKTATTGTLTNKQ